MKKICIIFSFLFFSNRIYTQWIEVALYQADCSALLTISKILAEEEFIDANGLKVNLVKYDGVGYAEDFKTPEHGIYILNREFKDYFSKGEIPKNYYLTLLNSLSQDLNNYSKSLIITSQKFGSDEIITFFKILNGKIYGFPHKTNYNCCNGNRNIHFIINKELEAAIKADNKIIWFGDELETIDLEQIIDMSGIEMFRRSPNVKKELLSLQSNDLNNKKFEPSLSSICNAIPKSNEELQNGEFSTTSVAIWQDFHKNIENHSAGNFKNVITTSEQLKNALIRGDEDMLFILAHSDGINLYIGDEKISIDDIKKWENRQSTEKRNRIAVLLICEAGNLNIEKGWLFWRKRVESLSEVFVEKNYFDIVLAPNHEIGIFETSTIFGHLLKGAGIKEIKSMFKGWFAYVTK